MWATSATYVGCVLGSTRVPHRTLIQSWDIEHGWMGEWDISHLSHLSLPACKAPWASLDPVYLQYLTWRRKAAETSTKTLQWTIFTPALRKEVQVSQDQLWPWCQTPELWPSLITSTWNSHELSLSAAACWQLSLFHLLILHMPMKFMSSLEDAFILKLAQSTAAPIL